MNINSTIPTQKWMNESGIFFPIPGDSVLYDTPGNGVFQVFKSSNPMDGRIGLLKISDRFDFNFKIYELGCTPIIETIRETWESNVFVQGRKNLGVIFNGIKGTGKTLSAKLLCNALGIPVIIVQQSYEGLLAFLQSLCFECVVFIDEAEKTFKKGEDDDILLRLIDGVYNRTRKLYVLTTNTLNLNDNLLGRPGRIRYRFEFSNLLPKAINDYLDDNLLPQYNDQREKILEQVDRLEISTIDILKALVDEVNIHGCLPKDGYMNIPTAKYVFEILSFPEVDNRARISEVKAFINNHLDKSQNSNLGVWLREKRYDGNGEPKDTNEDILDEEYDCVYTETLTSSSPQLAEGSNTSYGTINLPPDKDGYFMLKNRYDDTEHLCIILRKKSAPSLYKGALTT